MIRGRLRSSALRVTSLFVWDGDLFAYALRVMRSMQPLASHLDVSWEKRARLAQAALPHDLGKWFIPKTILYKADPLTEEERAIMRRHPELGSHFDPHVVAAFVVHSHHLPCLASTPGRVRSIPSASLNSPGKKKTLTRKRWRAQVMHLPSRLSLSSCRFLAKIEQVAGICATFMMISD